MSHVLREVTKLHIFGLLYFANIFEIIEILKEILKKILKGMYRLESYTLGV